MTTALEASNPGGRHSHGAACSASALAACPVCGGSLRPRAAVVRAGAVAECRQCGSWCRVPRPTLAELLAIYDDHYYDAWGVGENEGIAATTKRATFAPLIEELGRQVASRGQRRILDVGAATGLLLAVAREHGWEPFALELNPFAAKALREKFGPDRVFEGELPACTFEPGSFDAITMTDLIEHVLDVPGTLRAARGLLAPRGVLALSTPRIDSASRVALGRNWLHFKLEHIQYFSAQGMRAALLQAGFADVRIGPHSKRLSFDYLRHQLRAYPHWALTPMVRAGEAILPAGLRRRPLSYRCGEMLVLARAG